MTKDFLMNESKILFCLLFYILFISICWQYSLAEGAFDSTLKKHILRIIFGVLVMTSIYFVDFKFWNTFAYVFYLIVFLGLLSVEIMGVMKLGAQRWINFYFFTFQPSELMKLVLILALAKYYSSLTLSELQNAKIHFIPFLMIAIPAYFILKQPDLGTAMLLLGVGVGMMFLAGFPIRLFLALTFGGILLCPLAWFFLHDYQKNRILTFLNPDSDPLGRGYHVLQSQIAVGSGGLLGKGWMCGTQSKLDFLPEKNTDFIFTTIAEEGGFLTALMIVVIFLSLTLYCFWVANISKTLFSKLVCAGIAMLLFGHFFINIAMVIGLVPVVGIPLPFLSYGGSSLITFMICFGLIVASTRRNKNLGLQ